MTSDFSSLPCQFVLSVEQNLFDRSKNDKKFYIKYVALMHKSYWYILILENLNRTSNILTNIG